MKNTAMIIMLAGIGLYLFQKTKTAQVTDETLLAPEDMLEFPTSVFIPTVATTSTLFTPAAITPPPAELSPEELASLATQAEAELKQQQEEIKNGDIAAAVPLVTVDASLQAQRVEQTQSALERMQQQIRDISVAPGISITSADISPVAIARVAIVQKTTPEEYDESVLAYHRIKAAQAIRLAVREGVLYNEALYRLGGTLPSYSRTRRTSVDKEIEAIRAGTTTLDAVLQRHGYTD